MKMHAATFVANLCLALSASESNYFVGQINLADAIYQLNAFPIGVCSLTTVGFTSLSYGVYTCLESDQVTFDDYGDDSSCMSTPVSTTTYQKNLTLTEGEIGSFNCDGEDNYQVASTCTVSADAGDDEPAEDTDGGMDICCQDQGSSVFDLVGGGCLPYTSATGVCLPVNTTAGIYARGDCTFGEGVVEIYATEDCSGSPFSETDAATTDECLYSDRLTITDPTTLTADIYRLLTSCVVDSMELTNTTYCPSSAPTTEPTDMPTLEPTMESNFTETESTVVSEDSEETDSAVAFCVALSAIVSTISLFF